MPSTYTTSLTLEKQANGENSGTWGTKMNTVLDLIEQAIAGVTNITHDDTANYTLTATQGASNEARNMVVNVTGALTAARNVVVPTADKLYVFKNSTTGGYAVTIKTSGGTGISVANGETEILYCDGTNVLRAQTTPTGSGAPVRATSPTINSPTLTTPTLGVATATSINLLGLAELDASSGGGGAGHYNLVVGANTLPSATSAAYGNVAVGHYALDSVTGGYNNVCVGENAGTAITSGVNNICVGANTGASGPTTGSNNIVVGTNSGAITSGGGNIVVGSTTSYGASNDNIVIGYGSGGQANATINGNVTIGAAAGSYDAGGSYNTVVGYGAQADGVTYLSGSNNTVIGYQAKTSTQSTSNTVTLGNSSIATLRCQVTSITALSDIRDKTDIAPLPSGLSTVMALNPVRFTWNMRDGGKVGVKDSGFIAQDLRSVDDEYLKLVYAENPDKLEASYGRLIPVLVKAIQELKAEVDTLRAAQQR